MNNFNEYEAYEADDEYEEDEDDDYYEEFRVDWDDARWEDNEYDSGNHSSSETEELELDLDLDLSDDDYLTSESGYSSY